MVPVGLDPFGRAASARAGALVERAVQLVRVVVQPASPRGVIRLAGRDERPRTPSPCPNTRRCASSWMTTVSRASGGARIRRQENDSRPWREALPQRVRWSRTPTESGVTRIAVGVAGDLAIDRGSGPRLEPRFEERRGGPPIRRGQPDDDLVLLDPADALHRGPPRAEPRRLDPEPVQVAAIPQRRAVAQPAPRREVLPVARLAREMASQPWLPLAEERFDVSLGRSPSRAGRTPGSSPRRRAADG